MKGFLFFLSFLFVSVCMNAQVIDQPYNFPIKPGTEDWKKLKSGQEMAAVCNIPPAILSSLTTEALVETCLNYPLFNEVFYASDLPKGLDALTKSFNGFNELFKRKDAGKELLRSYKLKNPKDISDSSSDIDKGLFTFDFIYVELLLSHSQILNNLNSKERVEVAKEAIKKYDAKKERIDIFGDFGLTTSVFVIGKILKTEDKLTDVLQLVPKEELETFLATAMYSNTSTLSALYTAGKSL